MVQVATMSGNTELSKKSRERERSAIALSDFFSSSVKLQNSVDLSAINGYKNAWNSQSSTVNLYDNYLGNSESESWKKLWWWQPDQDSVPAEFLESSSMHGLKYASRPKYHLIER